MKNLSLLGMTALMATTLSAYGAESASSNDGTGDNTDPFPTTLSTTDDTATVAQGDSLTIDVLANDTGTDMYVFDVSEGSFSIADNKIVYNASGETGVTELWYGVKDAYGEESWSKVTITITGGDNNITFGEIRTTLKGNRCASVWDGDVGNGQRITLWDCAPGGAPSQQYTFEPYGDSPNKYRVKANHSGKCLSVIRGEIENGAKIVQWACEDTAGNAAWKLEPQSGGYRLRNTRSDRCMSVWAGDPENGAEFTLWDCADSQNMTFKVNSTALVH